MSQNDIPALNDTPKANRLHIGIFGRRNAGKSSLINALTGQDLAIVSDTPGTTADPVFKAMELHPIGPVIFIDTAGFDDEGPLGHLRVNKTRDIIARTDLAIVVIDAAVPDITANAGATQPPERAWLKLLRDAKIPAITVINKWDLLGETARIAASRAVEEIIASADTDEDPATPIPVSARTGFGLDALRQAIRRTAQNTSTEENLLSDLVAEGSLVLLVMPQDIQAPKGRLILPQVQTIRALLDRRCAVMSVTADGFAAALKCLQRAPDLIITDSQCFADVYAQKPEESALTSFSILMAAAKGDIRVFVDGAEAIDDALASDVNNAAPFRVLIAEACTHVPLNEDIGTVKIPGILRKAFGDRVSVSSVRGSDFPDIENLRQYDLIIHCGACMFNRRLVMSRIAAAQAAGVPITNYGVFLAKMTGILDNVALP